MWIIIYVKVVREYGCKMYVCRKMEKTVETAEQRNELVSLAKFRAVLYIKGHPFPMNLL